MTERSINEIAALAVKVRYALRIERKAIEGTKNFRAAGAISSMLRDFSDEQLCRIHDIIVASDDVTDDMLNGNNQRSNAD